MKATREQIEAAAKAQLICLQTTRANWMRPDLVPCEVCGGPHCTYECCDSCNYVNHTCHFCGDELGHDGVSACYITEDIENPPNYVEWSCEK